MLDYNRMIATWNEFIQEFPDAIDLEEFDLEKEIAIVKKIDNKWCVVSEDSGKRIGCYTSMPAAESRRKQVEMFQHMKGYVENDEDKELAKFQCECGQCGRLFWSGRRCDLSKCPSCGEQDDIEEITGET